MTKKLIRRITKKDLKIEYFRTGGPGGQAQNKKSTGVRITHPDSGATGESRKANRKAAFHRLVESEKFQLWTKKIVGEDLVDQDELKRRVDRLMDASNIKVEIKQEDGTWSE